jgi:hypothetical protein
MEENKEKFEGQDQRLYTAMRFYLFLERAGNAYYLVDSHALIVM